MLDLTRVRAAFPALASGYVFLDNAGGSQTLRVVAHRVRDYLLETSVQLGATYAVSVAAGERVRAAVAATADYVGAAAPEEIVIGPSATQLLANLALALAPRWAPGDEVIVSEADHHANVGPWQRLARAGVVVRTWPVDRETLRLSARGLEPLLGPRTRLVAFAHASNLTGAIHDVAELTRLAHSAGARVCVDGVAYAPHRALDVQAWGVDYYVISFYKIYGPHLAMLYGTRAALAELATINHDFIAEVPYRLQPGNLSFELTYGAAGIYEYLAELGGPARAFADIAAHEEQLAAILLEYLHRAPGVRVLGDPVADRARRVPTISFQVAGRTPASIVEAVDPFGIGIRHGDFYAKGLARAAGGPVVRVSAAHYNTPDEMDRLVEALDAALRGRRAPRA
jgi:cysteine desulfurase family protein (TIGR01976 family)